MASNPNPFYSGSHHGYEFYACSAEDRLARVKQFTVEQCQAALAVDGLQKTVRAAVERRIRQLREAR